MNLFWLCEHGEARDHFVRRFYLDIELIEDCPGGHPVEGGDKIWWCLEHHFQADEQAVNQTFEAWRQCLGAAYGEAEGPFIEEEGIFKGDYTPCRMVERFLIPLSGAE